MELQHRESEERLALRDAELRMLQQDLKDARQQLRAATAAALATGTNEHSALAADSQSQQTSRSTEDVPSLIQPSPLDPPAVEHKAVGTCSIVERRQRLSASFAAYFARAGCECLMLVLVGWRQVTRQRRRVDSIMKRTALALASKVSHVVLALYVSCWRSLLVLRKRSHRALQCAVAMRFAAYSSSVLMRAALVEWWRIMRTVKADRRLLEFQRRREEAEHLARERQLQDHELFELGKELERLRRDAAPPEEILLAVDSAVDKLRTRLYAEMGLERGWLGLRCCARRRQRCQQRPRDCGKQSDPVGHHTEFHSI